MCKKLHMQLAEVIFVSGILAANGLRLVAGQEGNANFPAEALRDLETQRNALGMVYLEFATMKHGTLTNYDYGPRPVYSAYFETNHFYRHEQIPGFENYDNQAAFDGQNIWWRDQKAITKRSLADAVGSGAVKIPNWPFLDSAGIYAPANVSEIEHFSALEPLALHYLTADARTKVESTERGLRLTFEVADELAHQQRVALQGQSNTIDASGRGQARKEAH